MECFTPSLAFRVEGASGGQLACGSPMRLFDFSLTIWQAAAIIGSRANSRLASAAANRTAASARLRMPIRYVREKEPAAVASSAASKGAPRL